MSDRPLEGIRIADFTWVWAGPFATMQLAHLGAEVIRIESTQRLDIHRSTRRRTCQGEFLPFVQDGTAVCYDEL